MSSTHNGLKMDRIPQINSFCCCSLKTASIIIGVLQFSFHLMYFIAISSNIIIYARNLNKKTFSDLISLLFLGQSIFSVLIFSLVLIYGAFKEKSNFVMAWIIFEIASFTDSLWNFIWNIVTIKSWKYFLGFTGFTVLDFLLLFVTFNFYRKIPKNKYIFHYQYST